MRFCAVSNIPASSAAGFFFLFGLRSSDPVALHLSFLRPDAFCAIDFEDLVLDFDDLVSLVAFEGTVISLGILFFCWLLRVP